MTEKRNEYCCAEVYDSRSYSGYSHRCSRKATVWLGGKGYCEQHDPREVERRRKETSAKWEAEWKEKALVDDLRQEQILAAEKSVESYRAGIPFPDDVVVFIKRIINLEETLEKLKL